MKEPVAGDPQMVLASKGGTKVHPFFFGQTIKHSMTSRKGCNKNFDYKLQFTSC